jgi:hypothetical protein
MLAGRRTATDVVREGVDAGALCDADIEEGADRVVDDEEVPSTVLDETVWACAPLAVGTDDGDGDVESTVEVAVVAVEAVEVVVAVEAVEVVDAVAIGRARIVRAPVASAIAINEAPIETTSAERRVRSWGVERSAVVIIPLKLCPCAFMVAIFGNQKQGAHYVSSTPCQINRAP